MRWLAFCLAFSCLAATVVAEPDQDEILRQRRELEQIKQDVQQGQKRLDSLRAQQQSVQRQVNEFDQRISSDRKVITRLNSELNQLTSSIAVTDSTLAFRTELLERNRRHYLGSIRDAYFSAAAGGRAILIDHPDDELNLRRKTVYLRALASRQSENIEQAAHLLAVSEEDFEALTGRRKMVRGLKKKRETSYALGSSQRRQQQKNLDQLKRKAMSEADRVIMLQQAAQEMAGIISRLEEQRLAASRSGPSPGPSFFAGLIGTLTTPYRGRITLSYGHHTDPVTHLKSFSPGITIKGRSGRQVKAVASGSIAYAGNLRGYGNFVIINHDRQYYTTYAGLAEIEVAEGQFVREGARLGVSGPDGEIKFELRRGRESLDPVEWINIESL